MYLNFLTHKIAVFSELAIWNGLMVDWSVIIVMGHFLLNVKIENSKKILLLVNSLLTYATAKNH